MNLKNLTVESIINTDSLQTENQSMSISNHANSEQTNIDSNQTEEKKKKKTTRTLPDKIINILSVANDVVKNWDENVLSIVWITKSDFENIVKNYNEHIDMLITFKGGRTPQVRELSNLDKEINSNVNVLKGALFAKYGKTNAKSHFNDFGIFKQRNNYIIPVNRNKRLKSLQTLVNAFDTYDIQLYDYGKQYWSGLLNKYSELQDTVRTLSGDISKTVAKKNNEKTTILKTLNAIVNGLKMNYPDDYKQIMRKWGFQKDRY